MCLDHLDTIAPEPDDNEEEMSPDDQRRFEEYLERLYWETAKNADKEGGIAA